MKLTHGFPEWESDDDDDDDEKVKLQDILLHQEMTGACVNTLQRFVSTIYIWHINSMIQSNTEGTKLEAERTQAFFIINTKLAHIIILLQPFLYIRW